MFSLFPFNEVEINQMNGKIEIKETRISTRCERNVLFILASKNLVASFLYFILLPFKTENVY